MRTTSPLLQRLLADDTNTDVASLPCVIDAIKHDVEGLLNSFAAASNWPKKYGQISKSILNYGLPNYLSADYKTIEKRLQLLKAIKKCIVEHEPRLFDVNVYMHDSEHSLDLILQIQIEAKIYWHTQKKSLLLQSDWNPLNMSFTLL